MTNKAVLDAKRLREVISYDPITGEFIRKITTSNRNKAGSHAGFNQKSGYLIISVDGIQYLGHRLAWLYVHGEFPSDQIDHINGDASDNRICNLRQASSRLNQENKRRPYANNKTKLLGVSWHAQRKRWRATIVVAKKSCHLGLFDTPDAAHAAYLDAKRKRHDGCTI